MQNSNVAVIWDIINMHAESTDPFTAPRDKRMSSE